MNPYLFVVGCPRSGTTLLQRMLDAHPSLTVANDTHFIPRALGGQPSTTLLSPELVERVVGYHRFNRLGINEAAARTMAEGAVTYRQFVERLYDALAASHHKPLAGDKTPDYVRHLPVLHGLFPAAKVIHIIRDGRDVALSALEWARPGKGPGRFHLWKTAPVAVSALWWARFVMAGRRSGQALGPDLYLEVSYEHLVDAPERVMRSVATHLDLPFDDRMLNFHQGRQRADPDLSAKAAWRPPTAGLRRWSTAMTQADIATFEALAGGLLDVLGYESGRPTGSPEAAGEAYAWREEWLRDLASQEGLDTGASAVAHGDWTA